jgi:hypothetical protein
MDKSNDCLLIGIRLVSDTEACAQLSASTSTSGRHTSSGYGSFNSLLSSVDAHAYNSKSTTSGTLTATSSHLPLLRSNENCQRIGLVVCTLSANELNLKAFRDLMNQQIARLPYSFVFLSPRR